ncbi:MAG: bifunctional 5,10-methylene-tetrahydrofolate dehydrogenase/5,10-methylene-tetrahydrofolate cyclohydrolase, partial [Cloacibacillus porcorum]|nr:bifunctional 5,10-methylene-tetrahydrofolate dehydrogenase/5,10-methylene-tetrahydrofolate cyclohydrolase [Cloacibacillus porcorum]
YNIQIEGRRAVVVGRSFVVGKPVAMMLLRRNATVTTCHTRTTELAKICREADILVVAIGKAKLLGADYLSPKQVIVDIGINLDEEGNLCGDVDYGAAEGRVKAITPVPGGIGRVTTAVLAKHVVEACQLSLDKLKNKR